MGLHVPWSLALTFLFPLQMRLSRLVFRSRKFIPSAFHCPTLFAARGGLLREPSPGSNPHLLGLLASPTSTVWYVKSSGSRPSRSDRRDIDRWFACAIRVLGAGPGKEASTEAVLAEGSCRRLRIRRPFLVGHLGHSGRRLACRYV
ncbi:uncharacterized protein B0T15DRAFT_243029 [Chaetomium strumarium]|uniref:Secreted protein n=1 Tax=Chaetomium strumarium TaxID=1170767 RepID=A0AAJ0GQZ4_9PEZI|nr:hypothetical protein B0T15DRAFT_243029 [Chaetomium strumarium]